MLRSTLLLSAISIWMLSRSSSLLPLGSQKSRCTSSFSTKRSFVISSVALRSARAESKLTEATVVCVTAARQQIDPVREIQVPPKVHMVPSERDTTIPAGLREGSWR